MPSTKCQDNTFKDAFTYGMYTRMTFQIFRKLSRSSHIFGSVGTNDSRCFLTHLNWSRPLMFSCFKLRMIGPRSLIESTKMAII